MSESGIEDSEIEAVCGVPVPGCGLYAVVLQRRADLSLLIDVRDREGRWVQWLPMESIEDLDAAVSFLAGTDTEGKYQSHSIRWPFGFVLTDRNEHSELPDTWISDRLSREQFWERCYEHQSFLLSNEKEGRRADFSADLSPMEGRFTRYRLPIGPWNGDRAISLNLRSVSFRNAILRGADLRNCDVRGADFSSSDLRSSVLRGLDLTGCNFRNTDLSGADLRETCGLRLDYSRIQGAKFSHGHSDLLTILQLAGDQCVGLLIKLIGWILKGIRAGRLAAWLNRRIWRAPHPAGQAAISWQDPWSRLRRRYTGPLMFIHGALLLCFMLPLMARAFFWLEVGYLQSANLDLGASADSPIAQPCLARECAEPQPIWAVLLRLHDGIWAAFLASSLVVYNGIRARLTYRVSLLREDEERSGFSPPEDEYRPLTTCHWVNSALVAPVIVSLVERAREVLFLTYVSLPD